MAFAKRGAPKEELLRHKRQVGNIIDLNKCMGCQTCTVACKSLWTTREGTQHMRWMNVTTYPGAGYPRDYEKMGGGYAADAEKTPTPGKLTTFSDVGDNFQFNHADVYYGGTTYDNKQGLGVQLTSGAERGQSPALAFEAPKERETTGNALTAYPVNMLYDRGNTVLPSKLLSARLGSPEVVLNPEDADALKLEMGKPGKLKLKGLQYAVTVWVDNSLPKGAALIPRSLGIPISGPTPIQVEA